MTNKSRSMRSARVLLLLLLAGCQGTIDTGWDEEPGGEPEEGGGAPGDDLRRPRDAGGVGDAVVRISLDGAGAPGDLARAPADLARPSADLVQLPSAYPAGPYGNQTGSVLADLVLAGYRLTPQQSDPAVVGWATDISFAEFHANPRCQCLLVLLTLATCNACALEQTYLKPEVAADPGFCVLNILQTGLKGGNPSRADVDSWVAKHKQNFFVAQGTNATRALYANRGTVNWPFGLIVRPRDMVIVGASQGYSNKLHPTAMGLCGK